MTLSFDQIASVTFGAAYIEKQDNGIHFHRFTREQEAAYLSYREDFYNKSMATAGVRLEFLTDSRHLSLSVASVQKSSSRPFFAFSLLCDGQRLGVLGSKTEQTRALSGAYTLGEGEKRITLYFPWSSMGVLQALSLDDGATLTPVKKSCRMLMLGDSITHGYDASEPQLSYSCRVADALDAEIRNKAIGGEIFFPRLADLPDEDFTPEIITVAYGTNDWSHTTREVFDRDSLAFYQNLSNHYPKAKIFAITPIWRKHYADVEGHDYPFFHVAEQLKAVAASLPNLTAIDGFDFVPQDLTLFTDGLHPNDDGFVHYAANLLKALRAHLPEAHIEKFS